VDSALGIKADKSVSLHIVQFEEEKENTTKTFDAWDDILRDISVMDIGQRREDVQVILSRNNKLHYEAREQWTDICNMLALKNNVVLGYDRNDHTDEAFRQAGFNVVQVDDLLNGFESGEITPADVYRTLILMPSAELSRARGGFHCMSMPLWREDYA